MLSLPEIEDALERNLLELHYQPIVSLPDRGVVGLEALCRFRHPERGLVPPREFIPAAEASGLIVPLGDRVISEVAQQTAAWRERHPGALPLGVFANVSPLQLDLPDFSSRLATLRAHHGLRPVDVGIEVTPTAMPGGVACLENLAALAAAGTPLAMDDFGAGYASLTALSRLPYSIVKLDRHLLESPGLFAAGASLGETLDVQVIAEGVETGEQARQVHELGCMLAQGFLFGCPQPATEISALLEPGPAQRS